MDSVTWKKDRGRSDWRTKVEHHQQKQKRTEGTSGKVSDTYPASWSRYASPLGSVAQCGTMISMNGADSLSDCSFALHSELGRLLSRTDSRLGFQQEVGTHQRMSACYYFFSWRTSRIANVQLITSGVTAIQHRTKSSQNNIPLPQVSIKLETLFNWKSH